MATARRRQDGAHEELVPNGSNVRRRDVQSDVSYRMLASGSAATRPEHVLALQRTAGNAAVRALIEGSAGSQTIPTVQTASLKGTAKGMLLMAERLVTSPYRSVAAAIARIKRNKARASDIKAVEAMADEMGYTAEVNKVGWQKDEKAILAMERIITKEAIDKGLTVNF